MENIKPKKQKEKSFKGKGIFLALLVLVGIFVSLIEFITDFLWFKELGYTSVFFTKLLTQLKMGVPVFLMVTLLSYVYFKYLKINYFRKVRSDEIPDGKTVNRISWGMAALFGGIVTYFSVSKLWFEFLKFSNSTDFNLKDPLFKKNISSTQIGRASCRERV